MSDAVECVKCSQPEVPGVMFFKTDGEWNCRDCAGKLDPEIEAAAIWIQNKVKSIKDGAKNANYN